MAEPKRTILLTHEFAPFRGGVATYAEEVASAAHRLGYPIEVWTQRGRGDYDDREFAFPVRRFPGQGTLQLPDHLRWFFALRATEVELRGTRILLGSVGVLMVMMHLWKLGYYRQAELVPILHGSEIYRFARNPWLRSLARDFFAAVPWLATASPFPRRLLAESFLHAHVSKTVVAPLGLRESLRQEFLKEPSASVASSDGKLRVLTVARLHPRKGQLEVARALGLLAERWRDQLIYQVCGRGDAAYAREVEETLRAAGVTVEMRGEVSSAELRDLYARCDVLAQASVTLPTSVEGFGLSYLEAGAYGKPVVGYRSGGTVDAVVDEGTGLLVAEGDTVALAQALERLLEDESLRRRMGGAGREWALRFSYDHSAQVLVGEKM